MSEEHQPATPAEESAAEVAEALAMKWLRENWADDLSGKQMNAIVIGVLRAAWVPIKVAALQDLADAAEANPMIPNELANATREVADNILSDVRRG